jgi:hypothetical protein
MCPIGSRAEVSKFGNEFNQVLPWRSTEGLPKKTAAGGSKAHANRSRDVANMVECRCGRSHPDVLIGLR